MSEQRYTVVCEDEDFEWACWASSPQAAAEGAANEMVSQADVTYDQSQFDVSVWLLGESPTPITHWRVTVTVTFSFASHSIPPASDDEP